MKLRSIVKMGFIASLLFILSVFAASPVFSQSNENAVVNSFIAGHAKKERAEEYGEAQKIIKGDVNGDGKADLVVLYSLEGFGGGNSYAQYLAVFLSKGKTYQYALNSVVGGKLNRDVTLVSISGGKINLATMAYAKNDAACCPSKKGKTRYAFVNGKLKEVK